jgi:hypothetical protein
MTAKGDTNLAVMRDQGEDLILSHLTEEQREAARRLVKTHARDEVDEVDLLWVLGLVGFEEEAA